MRPVDVLADRLALLRRILSKSLDDAPAHVQGFVSRVLPDQSEHADNRSAHSTDCLGDQLDAARFHGYPALARAGFALARHDPSTLDPELTVSFLRGVDQQRSRPTARHADFAHDTLALLGVADGLRAVSTTCASDDRFAAARRWTAQLLEQHGPSDPRLARARLLAGDLLDHQGRFGTRLAQSDDTHVAALDLCLWQAWPHVLRHVSHPGVERRQRLFASLLTGRPPDEADVLLAAVSLCALVVLTNVVAAVAVPDSNSVAEILRATQGSFRRWRWEANATRRDAAPARWLIDKEADVQAFLLAVLFPYFRNDLEDEQYLQGMGLRQGRFDFAIPSLRLIVEVKIVRNRSDMSTLEAQIADDLALYFKPEGRFSHMIVYVYDDSDTPRPENYATVRDALMRRDSRIVDVVIIQRPSMIPGRSDRSLLATQD